MLSAIVAMIAGPIFLSIWGGWLLLSSLVYQAHHQNQFPRPGCHYVSQFNRVGLALDTDSMLCWQHSKLER